MSILEKALKQNSPVTYIDKLTGIPSPLVVASKLHDEIYNRRFDPPYKFEFDYSKGEYVFLCDVLTGGEYRDFVLEKPHMTHKGEEIKCSCFVREVEIETEKLLK